jgi:phenylalanyl-tRNA synthetase beta chain
VTEKTRNVLLEGASWNFINIRRTMAAQKMTSEAGYRFSRGIHPAAGRARRALGLKRMLEWGGEGSHRPGPGRCLPAAPP